MKSLLRMVLPFTFITAAATTTCIFQALSYLLIKPFSLPLHRTIVLHFSYAFFLLSTFALERWSNMKFKAYGDPIPPKKSTFIILNHSSSVDFLIGLAYLAKLGFPNPGNTKSAVKDALANVPLFGTILKFTEFLFLSRSWDADRDSFIGKLSDLRDFGSTVSPFSVVLFPEGTRLTPERHLQSKAYTDSINQPALTHVLYPRFRGFITVVDTLGDRLDGIIDGTFIFEREHPSLKHVIAGSCKTIVHVHTTFHPIESIPKGEEEMESWLRDRWYEKEQRIANYHKDPSSLGTPNNKQLFPVEHPSALPLFGLVAFFGVIASIVVNYVSKIPNGLIVLSVLSVGTVVLVGISTMLSNRSSPKKSKSKPKIT